VLLDDGDVLEYTTVMVEERADTFFLAPPTRDAAKEEAVFDLPLYGDFSKRDLATTGFGESWDWLYRFPLEDGRSWSAEVFAGEGEVNFTATYALAIATPAGERPGFHVRGVVENQTFLDYDYVPELGWFAHFWAFDLSTAEPDDFEFHAMVVEHGLGWTGEYYVYEPIPLLGMDAYVAVDPEEPTEPELAPKPYEAFTVSAEAAYVYGFAYAWAFAGASETVLVDPNGEARRHTAVGVPFGGQGTFYDLEAVAGEWHVAQAGAGAATGGGVYLWELREEVGRL